MAIHASAGARAAFDSRKAVCTVQQTRGHRPSAHEQPALLSRRLPSGVHEVATGNWLLSTSHLHLSQICTAVVMALRESIVLPTAITGLYATTVDLANDVGCPARGWHSLNHRYPIRRTRRKAGREERKHIDHSWQRCLVELTSVLTSGPAPFPDQTENGACTYFSGTTYVTGLRFCRFF